MLVVSAMVGLGAVSARGATGAISLDGTPVSVAIPKANQNGNYKFAANAGTRVVAELTGSTFGPACPAVALVLKRPDGTRFGTTTSTCGGTDFLDTQTLDASGTWTVFVDALKKNTGTGTLRAWSVPADESGPIALNASATAVNLGTPGQNGRFTFTPTVGHAVSVELGGASFTGACPDVAVALIRPDGTQAAGATTCSATAFIDTTTIDQAGTWTVVVDPQLDATGSGGLQVWDVTDQHASAALGGATANVSLSEPGQNGQFTFTGTSGQKVSATVANATFPGCPAYTLSLVRPDGTTLGTPAAQCGATGFLDGHVLDQSGTWVVRVDPQGAATGTAQLATHNATDQVRSIKVGGPAVPANLLQPGQNSLLQFDGTSGTTISAQVAGATFSDPCPTFAFSLVRPDGSTLGAPVTSCSASAQLAALTLDQTGTWSLLVDAQGPATGTANVQALVANDQVRDITLNGARLGFSLAATEDGDFTFSGTTGQEVSADIADATASGCPGYTLSLQRPGGSQLGATVNGCAADAFLDSVTLDQTGTWMFVVHPVTGAMTGSIQAYTFTDLNEPADLSGKRTKLVFKHPGQNATLTFKGKNGDQISAVLSNSNVTGDACPAVAVTLVRPGGTTVAGPVTTCSDGAFLDTFTLNRRGTWKLIIDPQGDAAGTLNAQIFTVEDDVRPLPLNALRSFTAQQPGADGIFHFKGTAGQTRTLTISSSTFTGCAGVVVSFVRPNGTVLASVNGCDPNFALGPVTLDASGAWTAVVDPQGPGEGTMILKLTS